MKKTIVLTLVTGLGLGTSAFAALAQNAPTDMQGHREHFFEKLDANGDGVLTRSEVDADVQARFAEIDTNKDGKITQAELKAHAEAKQADMQSHMADHMKAADKNGDGKWSKDELPRMPAQVFSKLDTNNDGSLTQAELAAGHDKWNEHRDEFVEHMFEHADANNDGVVDASEAKSFAEKRFDKVDANHDGSVTREEWDAGHPHRGDHKAEGTKTTSLDKASAGHS
jgi:Ca2+-binding EF-hand superfamily protein